MTKRLIELDDELLAEAQRELHTVGVSDTVRAALRQAADHLLYRRNHAPQRQPR